MTSTECIKVENAEMVEHIVTLVEERAQLMRKS